MPFNNLNKVTTKVTVKEGRVEVSTYSPEKQSGSQNSGSNGTGTTGSNVSYRTTGGTVQSTATTKYGDKVAPSGDKVQTVNPSKTGDDNPVMLWILILLAAVAVGAGIWIVIRKRKRDTR